MKCRDLQDWLQDGLDIGQLVGAPDVSAHLRDCESCRRDVAAARVLLGGMTKVRKPETSHLLTASITTAVLADRAIRRRRTTYGWAVTAVLVASLLLLIGIGYLAPTGPQMAKKPDVKQLEPALAPVQLAQHAEDAQKAVASLTKSVTDTTRSRLTSFLPDREAIDVRLPNLPEFEAPLDPAAQSLKQAGLNVAHAFDPLAQTAARAFGYFAREVPALDVSRN